MAIINNLKLLPKSIESKMNARDLKKYTKLQKEWNSVLKVMIKAEQKSGEYFRKTRKNTTDAQMKKQASLDNATLKAFYFADKKNDEWTTFTNQMRKKYK